VLALTIAIARGDDAIIVLENAYRHRKSCTRRRRRRSDAHQRDWLRRDSTTIALVAVFTPLGFLRARRTPAERVRDRRRRAVVISGFVALTLTPMLCAKVLQVPHEHGAVFKAGGGLQRLADRYAKLLQWPCDRAS